MNELSNTASALGTYNGLETSITSEPITIQMVSGLAITKSADKMSWADGLLTYTIALANTSDQSYVDPVVTDVIDNTLTTFVANSVYINGVQATAEQYTYDTNTHTLTVNIDSLVATTGAATITFQVSKA